MADLAKLILALFVVIVCCGEAVLLVALYRCYNE
jgi:hypothetical protein